MFKTVVFSLLITGLLLVIHACDETDPICPNTQAYDFKLAIIKKTDSLTNRLKVYHPQMEPDSIDTQNSLSPSLDIPVNVTEDSTVFYIDFIIDNDSVQNTETDTLWFTYLKTIYLNEPECGFIMDFELVNIYSTRHHIDSAAWKNIFINEDNTRNLEIYY